MASSDPTPRSAPRASDVGVRPAAEASSARPHAPRDADRGAPELHAPTLNPVLAKAALTRFIQSQVRDAGATGVVLGLSGGIDSAVVAALSVGALGSDRVLGVLLPSAHSVDDDRTHAAAVAEWLGLRTETVALGPLVAAWRAAASDAGREREGNLTARLRMAVLYDRSGRDGSLVAGTGNKTEILLGYTTLWGDSAAAFVPLGDLYKTQVRELAAFLGVPEAVLRRAPSAGLWPGQTDEEELGATYETLDALLYRYVDLRHDLAALVRAGFDAAFARRTVERVHRNEFKRRPPLVPKLSTRTVGHDFLYPRQWGGPEAAARTTASPPGHDASSSRRGRS